MLGNLPARELVRNRRDYDQGSICRRWHPLAPALTHVMSAFLEEWGITLHKLRHSHASHLLAAKVHSKIVEERLGHSSIAITLDIYSHLMPNMQGEAAAAVDDALRSALVKRRELK
jgi:integrase